ncbi:Fic family protein [Streptococcus hillyeri]|uniref:Fic family protein n=1 Tax=Streptococcus hillyeri TaxID=2282420 RepID=UPI0034E1BC34
MAYKELKIIKFQHSDDIERIYQERLNNIGTVKTEMYPVLMKRGETKGHRFPLFVVPLLEIQILSQQIQEKSNQILSLSAQLPPIAQNHLYREQLYRAVIDTNEIEGVKTTRREVSDAYQAISDGKGSGIRLFSTVRLYQDILEQEPFRIDTIESIRDIYDKLTDGEIRQDDKPDGRLFRNGPVSILDDKNGKIDHIPPIMEETIILMLSSWIQFINDRTIPFLTKAFLAHYFFENIHPFYDGNGRIGRYILSRYLSRKLDIFSGLMISQKINASRSIYYKAFQKTGDFDNRAEGTFFVWDMMSLLASGQDDMISMLEEKIALLNDFWQELEEGSFTDLQREIMFILFQSTTFTDDKKDGIEDRQLIEFLSDRFARKKIKDTIKSLRDLDHIKQVTKAPSRHIV